jgi:GT2 family glycosyltransferase
MKIGQNFPNGKQSGLLLRVFAYILRKFDNRPLSLPNDIDTYQHEQIAYIRSANQPKVSIVIPTRDKATLLSRCLDSIREKTDYSNYEIIIVNNLSEEPTTRSLLENYRENGITVIDFAEPFNYSKICNFAASQSTGDFLCFLNNDTEVISKNWLSSMVEHASKNDIGVVGALLTYPEGTIQHMGIALGYKGVAGHPYRGYNPIDCLPSGCYEVSGSTFACAMISKAKFSELGGLDEKFPVGFNDVDFCIRSTSAGFRNIMCLEARLTHVESQTRKRTLTFSGAIQGTKDVLSFLRVNRTNFEERFFSAQASE